MPAFSPLLATVRRLLALALFFAVSHASWATPAVALYYGERAGLADFRAFDTLIVDPDHLSATALPSWSATRFYAYAAVGEVQRSRAYDKDIPSAWKIARNSAWDSDVLDQTAAGWPAFFADRVIAPLWAQGYRGFFLDALDSYRLAAQFDEAAQQQGLVRVIDTLHQRFPGIKLILNRGFDILPRLRGKVEMVAAESLYQRWNASAKRYEEVPEADRQWLLGQLRTVRERDGLPVLAIDYVAPQDRALARRTAARIAQDGFIPWVSNAELTGVGVGSIEPVARRILVLYNSAESPALNYANPHRYLQMPLNHLGYVVDYADILQPLPPAIDPGRYAGVVAWFSGFVPAQQQQTLSRWLQARIQEGTPLAVIGDWGLMLDPPLARTLGVQTLSPEPLGSVRPTSAHPMLGLEAPPPAAGLQQELQQLTPAMARSAQTLLAFDDAKGARWVGGALTPWGGFILDPNVLAEIPGTESKRWIIDPFAFLQQALRLPALPIPDTTTENGRRLLLAHVDGDGFPSLAEFAGSPLAAQVLLKEVFEKYRIPQTMSIIEAEVAPHGLYPDLSPRMEDVARAMLRLPHIEVGSHSYSHPFLWDTEVSHGLFKDNPYAARTLPIPGYTLNLEREIVGSTQYINQRLAPANKPVKIMQWTGDTAPSAQALAITARAGLLNINGGDTSITRTNPTLTAVGALGIQKNGFLQVYAPITNENIYTNLWTGPYYGYERAIETFEMTGAPRRIKPVGIYYHVYAASKRASLKALHKVYDWALAQPLHPVFATEFAAKVQDFHTLALAREDGGWRVRGDGALRTLRLPTALGQPQPSQSQGIAGWHPGPEGAYVHLSGPQAWLRTAAPSSADAPSSPVLYEANARIAQWQMQPQGGHFELQGHVPLQWSLDLPPGCQARSAGRTLAPLAGHAPAPTTVRSFRLNDVSARIQVVCPAR